MTDPPRNAAAGAGLTLVATMVLGAGLGLGLGSILGIPVPLLLVGLFAGSIAGFALVYSRFKDI